MQVELKERCAWLWYEDELISNFRFNGLPKAFIAERRAQDVSTNYNAKRGVLMDAVMSDSARNGSPQLP